MSNPLPEMTETLPHKYIGQADPIPRGMLGVYIIGDVLKVSKTVTLGVTKFDNFGGAPHYGIKYVISPIGQPSYAHFGWIPCEVLDGMDVVKLYNLEA